MIVISCCRDAGTPSRPWPTSPASMRRRRTCVVTRAAPTDPEFMANEARAARATLTPPVGERDHTSGATAAPVTLLEYGDFECPSCRKAYPMVKELQRRLGKNLRFVFRNCA